MYNRILSLALFLSILLPALSTARTVTVRQDGTGDHETLQDAFSAAVGGDTVLVGPGRYDDVVVEGLGYQEKVAHAFVHTDGLIVVGEDRESVIIGSSRPYEPGNTPEGLWLEVEVGSFRMANLTLENCSHAIIARDCRVTITDCTFRGNYYGADFHGVDLVLARSVFVSCRSGVLARGGTRTLVDQCRFVDNRPGLSVYGDGILIRDSEFSEEIGISTGSDDGDVMIVDCTFSCSIFNLQAVEGRVHLLENHLGPSYRGIIVDRGAFVFGTGNVLEGAELAGVQLREGGRASLTDGHILPGAGPAILVDWSNPDPFIFLDFRHNYWGTADEFEVEGMIHHAGDDAGLGIFIQYSPIAGAALPTELMNFGSFKALYR